MLIYGFKLAVIPFYEDHSRNGESVDKPNEQYANRQSELEMSITVEPPNVESSSQHVPQPPVKAKSQSHQTSYTIDLRKLDNWLEMRIIDIEFLYGYYEPTLFILCESNMTWVGRYAIKKDTCNSLALSLNLNQRSNPIIWPVEKLPSDCIKCYAVPPPIGGVMIFGVNSLIYLNQSVPAYAISLNSIAKTTSNYPFKNMESKRITLDNSRAVFIESDRMIVSLKGGELYLITMITDSESLRSVRNFSIEKCAGSVISSCICKCCDNYLFVGSRLANSVLLKYSTKSISRNVELESEIAASLNETDNQNELSQVMIGNRSMDTDDTNAADMDELDRIIQCREGDKPTDVDVVTYSFEICDIVLNIGPCGQSIIGESVGDYSDFDLENNNLQNSQAIDLVTSSGYTKNGAISVLQRSLRPDVIATFQIPDIIDMWSVANDSQHSPYSPTYLFLSKSNSTVVLLIANEITELDKDSCVFCTKAATIYCGNILDNKYIVQITTNAVYVYNECLVDDKGPKVVHSLDLIPTLDSKIKDASAKDDYLVVLSESGTIKIVTFDQNSLQLSLMDTESSDEFYFLNNVSCFSLFKDESTVLSDLTKTGKSSEDNLQQANIKDKSFANIDDEEELLYGESEPKLTNDSSSSSSSSSSDHTWVREIISNSSEAVNKIKINHIYSEVEF